MSDGLPTEEQLRRIERGVQRRIDLRRAVARRIAGTTAAVALLGGGFALVLGGGMGTSGGGSTSAGGTAASAASAAQEVECHVSSARDSSSVQRGAPAGADDQRLITACGAAAVDFQSQSGRMATASPGAADSGSETSGKADSGSGSGSAGDEPAAGSSASPSLSGPTVLCVADDGMLHVFPADDRPTTLCSRNGMRPR